MISASTWDFTKNENKGDFTIAPLELADMAALLPFPSQNANKYTRGKLNLVVGSSAYPGAACLSSAASTRSGAGYAEVFCAPESMGIVRSWQPSLVVTSWDKWRPADRAYNPLHHEACTLGCGFDPADTSTEPLVFQTLEHYEPALLIDAGALALLATDQGIALAQERAQAGRTLTVTPHTGEASRLAQAARIELGDLTKEDDCAALACALSDAYGATVVLKGPRTYIAEHHSDRTEGKTAARTVHRMDFGTAALAKAGTGDILAGMIGALLAQGLSPVNAACLGTTLHAQAGQAAAERFTEICVTPEDVIDALPQAVRLMGR